MSQSAAAAGVIDARRSMLPASAVTDAANAGRPHDAALVNTQTKHLPVGHKLDKHAKSSRKSTTGNSKVCKGRLQEPAPHSTRRLTEALEKQQLAQPDISLLLQQKISSPATANRICKKSVSQLNHSENAAVYDTLVSNTVSEASLRARLQQQLIIRDGEVRHNPRAKLRPPTLADWYCPEDYVSMTPHSSLYDTRPLSSCCSTPRTVATAALCRDGRHFLTSSNQAP